MLMISNDDGIEALGLLELIEVLTEIMTFL